MTLVTVLAEFKDLCTLVGTVIGCIVAMYAGMITFNMISIEFDDDDYGDYDIYENPLFDKACNYDDY